MPLIAIPFQEINLQEVKSLIDNQDPEPYTKLGRLCCSASARSQSRHLEFKRQLPGSTDIEKKEFLADVTAMANSCIVEWIRG